MRSHRIKAVLVAFALASATAHAAAPNARPIRNTDVPIQNWEAPPEWTPSAESRDPRAAEQDAAAAAIPGLRGVRQPLLVLLPPTPLTFVPITPCRVADTRGFGFTGQYGPPALQPNALRNFTIGGQCGIPVGAQAVSFEFTAVGMNTNGNLIAWQAGIAPPISSALNWTSTTGVIANGIVIPINSSGVLSVQTNVPAGGVVDLIIDVNGYYGPTGSLPSGTASNAATVNANPFYLYSTTVTLPKGGACLVTSQAQFLLSGSPTSNIFYRIAVKRGAAADADDTFYGHYFGTLSGSSSIDQSRTSVITVNPSEATQFGCFVGGVNAGDQTGNLYLTCQTTYLCF